MVRRCWVTLKLEVINIIISHNIYINPLQQSLHDTISVPVVGLFGSFKLCGLQLRISKSLKILHENYFANPCRNMAPCMQMQNNQSTEMACAQWIRVLSDKQYLPPKYWLLELFTGHNMSRWWCNHQLLVFCLLCEICGYENRLAHKAQHWHTLAAPLMSVWWLDELEGEKITSC